MIIICALQQSSRFYINNSTTLRGFPHFKGSETVKTIIIWYIRGDFIVCLTRVLCVLRLSLVYDKTTVPIVFRCFIISFFHPLLEIVRPIFTSRVIRVYYFHKIQRHFNMPRWLLCVYYKNFYFFFGRRPENTVRFSKINNNRKQKTLFRSGETRGRGPTLRIRESGGGTSGTRTC